MATARRLWTSRGRTTAGRTLIGTARPATSFPCWPMRSRRRSCRPAPRGPCPLLARSRPPRPRSAPALRRRRPALPRSPDTRLRPRLCRVRFPARIRGFHVQDHHRGRRCRPVARSLCRAGAADPKPNRRGRGVHPSRRHHHGAPGVGPGLPCPAKHDGVAGPGPNPGRAGVGAGRAAGADPGPRRRDHPTGDRDGQRGRAQQPAAGIARFPHPRLRGQQHLAARRLPRAKQPAGHPGRRADRGAERPALGAVWRRRVLGRRRERRHQGAGGGRLRPHWADRRQLRLLPRHAGRQPGRERGRVAGRAAERRLRPLGHVPPLRLRRKHLHQPDRALAPDGPGRGRAPRAVPAQQLQFQLLPIPAGPQGAGAAVGLQLRRSPPRRQPQGRLAAGLRLGAHLRLRGALPVGLQRFGGELRHRLQPVPVVPAGRQRAHAEPHRDPGAADRAGLRPAERTVGQLQHGAAAARLAGGPGGVAKRLRGQGTHRDAAPA